MSALLTLGLLYLATRNAGNGALRMPSMPAWPTASSPPPPMPAFQPQPQPAPQPTADTGTPLSELHAAPPVPVPAAASVEPAAPKPKAAAKPKPKPKPLNPAQRAAAAAKKMALRKVPRSPAAALSLTRGTPLKSAAVADVQAILNARGAKLKRDGLYGPATANAWMKAAKSKGLPAAISRGGPKIARVAIQTYDALKTPPIP